MHLFLSTYKNKIDSKLRVSVPAQFRSVIAKSSFNGIIIYKSISNNCLEGCGIERLEDITQMIDNLDPFSDEREAFATTILGGSHQLSFDTEGRIVLPSELVKELNISKTAVFIGKGRSFEIWSEDEFSKHFEKSKSLASQNRDKIKNVVKINTA